MADTDQDITAVLEGADATATVSVVIVTYNSASALPALLGSLPAGLNGVDGFEVIIVDNDSRDGSFERIDEYVKAQGWNDRVEVVAASRNGGFAAGNNVGLRTALARAQPPEFFYFINPDATPEPGAIAALLRCMGEHLDAGIAGSRVHDAGGTAAASAFRFPSRAPR